MSQLAFDFSMESLVDIEASYDGKEFFYWKTATYEQWDNDELDWQRHDYKSVRIMKNKKRPTEGRKVLLSLVKK